MRHAVRGHLVRRATGPMTTRTRRGIGGEPTQAATSAKGWAFGFCVAIVEPLLLR